jgi:hypothetical protein
VLGKLEDLPNLIGLVEAQDVLDVVLGASIGDILGPSLSAVIPSQWLCFIQSVYQDLPPLLVGVEEGDVFEALDGFSINHSLPIIHPADS